MISAPLIISVLVFSAIILFVSAALAYAGYLRGRQTIVEKIKHSDSVVLPEEEAPSAAPASESPLKTRWLALMTRLGKFTKPKDEEGVSHIQRRFLQAGYRSKNAVLIFFGSKVFCAAVLLVGVFVFQLLVPGPVRLVNATFVAIVFALIGLYLPNVWLMLKIARRKEALTIGFPDALDLLVVCTEAGMGLDAAMKRVGEEMKLSNKALSEELRLLNLELRAGKSRKDALKNLALRADLEEVNSLTTLLVQTDRFGTSVAQALRVHSDSMRTRRTQRIEELAAKLPVKLLFPTVFCIFPSLFLVILGPGIINASKVWNG